MSSKEKQKTKKTHRNLPSFSSSLLDEICRSIDAKGQSPEKLSNISRSSRASLVDKLTESKEKAKKMENRDNEFFYSSKNSNPRPKPVRTSVSVSPHPNRALFSPDDDNNPNEKSEEIAKAIKIYENLKKQKQPISPGMKLTNMINSVFNRKKSSKKDVSKSKVHQEEQSSCVYKNPSYSHKNDAVRLDPVSKQKSTYDDTYERSPLPDVDEEDACSELSSDLFELDHLSLFGTSDEFCEELPVYKTTSIGKNKNKNKNREMCAGGRSTPSGFKFSLMYV